MRQEGQLKSGFFPAPEEAVRMALRHLECNVKSTVLDPCAGKGAALQQIAKGLKLKPFAIELDETRADVLRPLWAEWKQPEETLLAPCSLFTARASGGKGFGLVWCNPPYDDEIGGGDREERKFLGHVSGWITPGGILCMVVPERFTGAYSPIGEEIHGRFDQVRWRPFPDNVRKFGEVVIFGIRRRSSRLIAETQYLARQPMDQITTDDRYVVPWSDGPARFEKTAPTDLELGRMLAASPLTRLFEAPETRPPARPPLPLNKGHIALMLASGHLDGLVCPPGEPPHLIRGTASKEVFLKDSTVTENDDGSETTREVFSEKINLVVRALLGTGEIKDFK
jgi:hypothetical protein